MWFTPQAPEVKNYSFNNKVIYMYPLYYNNTFVKDIFLMSGACGLHISVYKWKTLYFDNHITCQIHVPNFKICSCWVFQAAPQIDEIEQMW